jgi:hypothetical protein
MSIDIKRDEITVNGITYDVSEESVSDYGTTHYIIEHDGENVFPGLSGHLGHEVDGGAEFNPREHNNLGVLAVHYPRYDLGDEDISKIDFEVECKNCDSNGTVAGNPDEGEADEVDCTVCAGNGYYTLDPAVYFKAERGARVVIGLFVYEHSGITMSAGPRVGDFLKKDDIRSTDRFVGDSQGWDTSFVGFIFDEPEKIKTCFGDNATDEQIEYALRQEVKTYAAYLEGDITWYSVDDDESDFQDGCCGFVGDFNYCYKSLLESLEAAITKRLAEQDERAHWAARDVETV